MIVKAKNFSTVIDLIRVGDKSFYSDDMKLKIITSETNGGIFYCDEKRFLDVLNSLIKSKHEFNLIKGKDEGSQILEDDKIFYERLAADLISIDTDDPTLCDICKKEICPICDTQTDELRKCYNCQATYHSCCIATYAITNNIGFKHIFRCLNCETLLKIDESYANMIYEEEYGGEVEEILEIDQNETISPRVKNSVYDYENFEEEENEEDALVSEQNIEKQIIQEKNQEELTHTESKLERHVKTKKVKIGGYFGHEIEVNTKQMKEDKINSVAKVTIEESIDVPKKSIVSLNPPKKKSKIRICNICGATVRGGIIICPNCGCNLS